MSRVGLALSGGGFRASLYHLGVLRFLRDADLLHRISHITSVSGGSIIAAHLVLHWDRFTGTEEEFDEAAGELLDFIRLDVRNRVVRRFPLAFAANSLQWVVGRGRSRRLTRPGLLEQHYEKFLYGDRCLYELPTVPQLHILATNVNEGCLCSFTRSGLLVERRQSDGTTDFESVPSSLATLPIAVTASSAFPGFFPPLQVTASDVGAEESRFPPHLFTDGGVYDNLGVRMFRCIRDSWIRYETPLHEDDFVDLESAFAKLDSASHESSSHESSSRPSAGALARLKELIRARSKQHGLAWDAASLPPALSTTIELDELYREDAFKNLTLDQADAEDLRHLALHGRVLDRGDRLGLNRFLVDAAFRAATGQALLRTVDPKIDKVIVSDAGKQFTVSRKTKGGGLIGTAMRASDILMNRVWQLENDHFQSAGDFIFVPMSMSVQLSEDPTALHPELQHQVTNTRTDLDRFSDLEISSLVRHGYGVMRKVCRSRPDLFGDTIPENPPWDPTATGSPERETGAVPNPITSQARELQSSSQRRIFARLLNVRDWPTYVYVPLLLLLLIGLPFYSYQRLNAARRDEMIVDAITNSNPDFQLVLQLARRNPVPGQWEPIEMEQVAELEELDLGGFRLITDTRVLDTRAWKADQESADDRIVSYRRMQVRRVVDPDDLEDGRRPRLGRFRIQQFDPTLQVSVRNNSDGLVPILRVCPQTLPSGESGYMYEAEFDLSRVPAGADFDIGFELTSPGVQGRSEKGPRLTFPIIAPTELATMWVLLPKGRPYRDLELLAYDRTSPTMVMSIDPTYSFELADGSMFGWMVVAPDDNYMYECRWTWDNE